MNQTQNTPSKRESEQEHRKQVTWQILVPILAAVAIAWGIALLAVLTQARKTSNIRNGGRLNHLAGCGGLGSALWLSGCSYGDRLTKKLQK